jgi:hypothetical protein
MHDLPSTRLDLLCHEPFAVMTACSILGHPKISLSYPWRQRGSAKRQIGFQKFTHYRQHWKEWPDFQLVTRIWHAHHVISLVCYNYWNQDNAVSSINKWVTVVYEIFSIHTIKGFVVKPGACTWCQQILKGFYMCNLFLWHAREMALTIRWRENIHAYVFKYYEFMLK